MGRAFKFKKISVKHLLLKARDLNGKKKKKK